MSAVCGDKWTLKYEYLNDECKNFDFRKIYQFITIPKLYLVGIEIGHRNLRLSF